MIARLAELAGSRTGLILVTAWAFAEAVFFPVVPDIALLPLVVAAPRATARLSAGLLGGAITGSLVLAALVAADPGTIRSMLLALPGIDAGQIAAAGTMVAADGALAFGQLGPGIPLKVYTEAWAVAGGSPLTLVGAVVLNRVTRIGPEMVVAVAIGRLAPAALRRHGKLALTLFSLAWVGVYIVYWRII